MRLLLAPVCAVAMIAACGGDSTGPPPEPLAISTTSLPDATIDLAYSAGIGAEGGNEAYEWTVSEGTLPPGLELVVEDLPANDALITGAPTQIGTFSFSVRVNSGDGQSVSRQFEIRVTEPQALSIGNPALPPALVGGPYAVQLRGVGGTGGDGYSWSLAGGTLPAGLTLSATGRIEGEPETTDTVTLTLRVERGGETYTEDFLFRALANRPGEYNIIPVPVAPVPEDIQPHLDAAIDRWEKVITGDLVPVSLPTSFLSPSGCGGFGEGLNGTTVDDILIMVNIDSIDGPGKILARAGPCVVRDTSNKSLTIGGILTLDSGDLLPLVGSTTLTDIIAHEIGHVLGFGSLWEHGSHDLLDGEGSNDPRFTGAGAVAEWHDLGGEGDVPVEAEGGEGTAESHWRESVFDSELMTGFSEPIGVSQPLSRVTVGAMEDLGYVVDYSAADSYSLGSSLLAHGTVRENLGYDILLREPVRVLDTRYTPLELLERSGGTR
ncbi:MAG TPA: putative Ig domain-containing protein [Gemmatimonadota bacterium]|nr:putative Ig domain-containing protein [Gemmatimonadota bacterium]